MPDDQIKTISTRPRPLADVGLGANLPVLPPGQIGTTTALPVSRVAATTWQGFVPGEPHGSYSHDIFSAEPGGAYPSEPTTTDAAGSSAIAHARGKQGVDTDALHFQLAIYQSVASHPQCAVLADLFEEAGNSGTLDLNGISPTAVDQMPEEVWKLLRGVVGELLVPPDTSHETEQRWKTALALQRPAIESARAQKRALGEEVESLTDVPRSRKRRAVGSLGSSGERHAERIEASVGSSSAQPSAASLQQPVTPAAYAARSLKVLELLSANPKMSTQDLVAALNTSAGAWSTVNAQAIDPIRRYFMAMKDVSQGTTPHNVASHVYAVAKDNPELTTDEVRQRIALRIAPEQISRRSVADVLPLMWIAINNGHLPGTRVRPSTVAAAKESAERDLKILRICAKSPSISASDAAIRLKESTPKQWNSLKTILMFVRIIEAAHRQAPDQSLAPLERIYVRLRDDERWRADDPASVQALEGIWR